MRFVFKIKYIYYNFLIAYQFYVHALGRKRKTVISDLERIFINFFVEYILKPIFILLAMEEDRGGSRWATRGQASRLASAASGREDRC